jgi:hypothetical protein
MHECGICMKKTIKQWCQQYDIDWYGQGTLGPIWYDWKLVFPNINSKKNNGKISENHYLEIIRWVNETLDTDKEIRTVTNQ